MLISICIPHYNRSKYLLKVLDSIELQTYKNIEVIISDDCSTDDSEIVIPQYIDGKIKNNSNIIYKYIRHYKNLGYDANLRASLANGTGDYLFTLGNDDALSSPEAIKILVSHINEFNSPDIIFCNYLKDGNTTDINNRATCTGIVGQGVQTAVKIFRSFSFVGGIIIKKPLFDKYNSNLVDGSIFFQIYLATKIISSGGIVSSLYDALVLKDIRIANENSNSYLDTLKIKNKKMHAETGGLDQVFNVAYLGIKDSISIKEMSKVVRYIYSQILIFSYPIWLITYRHAGVYKAAINLALGNWPSNLVKIKLSIWNRFHIYFVYFVTTIGGLFLPTKLILYFKNYLGRLSKK